MIRAALLALALAACVAPSQQEGGPDLDGTAWRRVDDDEAQPHVPTLVFTADAVSGYDGCTAWSGAVVQSGARLHFDTVAANRIWCAESSAAAQRRFHQVLSRTHNARLDGDQLALLDAAGVEIARFDSDVPPALDLDGTSWRRIDRAEDAAHRPTLRFEGGRAGGDTGCNQWGAAIELEGERLSFSDAIMTEMACPGSPMATEAAFTTLLTHARFARMNGATLELMDEGRAVIARFERIP